MDDSSTLNALLNLFLDQYKPTTRRAYLDCLRPLVQFIGPARTPEDVKRTHLLEYSNHLNMRSYSPATVRKHIKAIKTWFNWLVRIGFLPATPADVLRAKRLALYVQRDKAIKDHELEQVLQWTKFNPRNHALILFLADTGCRAGGAANLTITDLHLDRLTAEVVEKGDRRRPVAYGRACADAVRVWLQIRPASAGIYVFSRTDQPIKPANISQIVRRACLRVGVRSLGSHALRHRKGHQLADAKVAPSVAARALGHQDVTTTLQNYYPADWETAERELRKLAQPGPIDETKIVNLPRRISSN